MSNNKEDMIKEISDVLKENKKIKTITFKMTMCRLIPRLSSLLTIPFLFLGVFLFKMKDDFAFLRKLPDFLLPICVIVVVCLVLTTLFSRKALNKKFEILENEFYKILYKNDKVEMIYEKYFIENCGNSNVSGIDIIFEKSSAFLERGKGNHKNYMKDLKVVSDFNVNRLEFNINGKKAIFIINSPLKFVERRGKSTVTYYVSSNAIFIDNKFYDYTFSGVKVKPGKAKEENYKTESVAFNKLYRINKSQNDLIAPKFLSPKIIDGLTQIDIKDFHSVGVEDYVHFDRCSSGKAVYPIGVMDIKKVLNWNKLAKLVVDKMELDVKLFKDSLKVIDLFA
ncbi:hypothetical protein SCHIN_v1c09300 [Spiroplasma chinense]|uniref:DUF3137 domain-containing protein n=1 Tax=Spiroplasma chinense TaxID=216932 RepID=A0A5B9Y5P3_9MOLU|nr:hypothetical protein [Spiroplasma chinense]QEH62123.1 hypothetical protein SCHIN_v1c09300 [Spiroplasma chinense]